MRVALGVWALLVATVAGAAENSVVEKAQKEKTEQTANPFDPSLMLREPIKEEKQTPDRLKQAAVYRIEGVRFQKFYSDRGAVYIESPSSIPDFERGRVLCLGEMHPTWEIIRIREGVVIGKDVKQRRQLILNHIANCSG